MNATFPAEKRVRLDFLMCGILLFMALALFSLSSVKNNSHAVEKHGATAEIVRQCPNFQPELSRIHANGRIACIFQVEETGKFGVRIFEIHKGQVKNITSFLKEKMSTPSQVLKYLENRGYSGNIPDEILQILSQQ